MGFRDKREQLLAQQTERKDRDEHPEQQYEYLARNLKHVAGMALENDFNKHGAEGWEFVAVADEYAIFKRRVP